MLVQTSPPAIEPVTVIDAKAYSRIIDNSEDTLTALLITAARRYAEAYTGRSFITQSWRQVLDTFPGRGSFSWSDYLSTFSLPDNAILLDRGDVQTVSSITYLSMTGATLTASPSTYIADLSGSPARITPVFGQIWPADVMPQIASVKVDYVAGYGATADLVPEGIRQWILMRVATMYENREEVALLNRGRIQDLPFVDSLLAPYSVLLA